MGYYIPKSDLVGFDPDIYGWDRPVVVETGICWDETCHNLVYYRIKKIDYSYFLLRKFHT